MSQPQTLILGRASNLSHHLVRARRRGVHVQTESRERDEVQISTANVDRLAELVDVGSFRRAVDWVVEEVLR